MKDIDTHKIDEIASKGDGMTVPEGYFDSFATKMVASLPFREELDIPVEKQKNKPASTWMRIRPYVYMAAMFAGAWCLIKMFSIMSPSSSGISLDNYPSLSLALEDEQFVDDYIIDDVSTYDVMESSYYESMGIDPESEYDLDAEQVLADNENPGAPGEASEEHEYILPTDNR